MWTSAHKSARLKLMRQMGICTRCQRGVTRKYALCLSCRRKETRRWHARQRHEASKATASGVNAQERSEIHEATP